MSQRRAFIAGVEGKLGEALLSQLVGSEYATAITLAETPFALGARKLKVSNLPGLESSAVDDANLCMNDRTGRLTDPVAGAAVLAKQSLPGGSPYAEQQSTCRTIHVTGQPGFLR